MMLHEMHEDHGHVEIYMQKQNKTKQNNNKKKKRQLVVSTLYISKSCVYRLLCCGPMGVSTNS